MEKDEARDIFVEVLHDYRYEKDGRGIAMKQGEIFLVLNRNNADWWQVIRRGELRPFFAPCSYIKTTSVTKEHMKEALSQKMLMENAEPGGKDALGQTQASQASVPPQHPVKSLSDVKKHLQQGQEQQQDQNQQETSKKSATGQVSSGKSHITRIETQMSLVERQEGPQQRRSTFSTFRSVGSLDGPVVQSPKENNSVVYGSHRSLKASPSGSKASLTECKPYVHSTQPFQITSNPSKSSLESLSVQRSQHKFIKAASHDELVSCERSESMFDVSQPKAASSEELDHKRGCKDAGFQSNRLSYHHRSNSVDFRLLHKDLSLSEIKQSSLEKYRRQRLSKDPFNRRKSWAVEEVKVPENVKLTHGEAVDAAIVLDVPPKLPPKQRKNRSDPSGTNLESLRKLEGPVDLCIQGTNKSITATIQERSKYTLESLDREFVPRHELVGQSASLPRIPSKETKDPPVALPRKHLPPTKSASLDSQNNNNNNNKNNNNDSGIKEHKWGPLRKKESVVISSIRLESSNDSMKRDSKTSDPWRSVALESFKKGKSSPTPVKQDERKDNEFQRLSPRNAPTPDLSIMGKTTSQLPPSPTVPPQRVLFDNWGEYLDGSSGRPFFYNASTREKRWKPPRKGIHSVSIPEVPSSSSERKGSSLGRSLPPVNSGSPSLTLNYPNSPNLSSHQSSFSSANLSEPSSPQYYSGHSSLPYQSSDSLGNGREGASVLCHKNSVNGVQFPGTPSTSLKFTSPPVPPSSAKPIYNTKMPSTPTTPDGSFTGEFDDKESVLLDCMDLLETPQGWEKKYDAFSQRVYFQNQTTKERNVRKGKQLTGSLPLGSSLSGDPSLQCRARALSEESRAEMIVNTRHEGFLRRTWFMKDGKKQRKNWANMYVRYIPGTFIEGSNGLLFLTRNKNFEDDKKVESFHLYTTCIVENGEKKTSRPNTICLKNGQGCELLLQADDSFLLKGWIDVLRQHEGVLFSNTTEGEDKKGKKIGDKLKKAASVENLNPDNKGIREKLRFLIKRRPTQEILVKKGIYKEAVFGSILTTLCTKDSTDVPLFVLQCIKNIEKSEENLKSDGLYRISGNAAVVQKIRLEVEQRNYAILEEEKDVHNLTGALKLFFRELKEPLIPFVNYDTFIQATASAENRKSGKQAELLEKAVRCLPKQHHDTLRQLLRHLKRVSEYEKVNRMSIMNLAIVLGPCVLWPETTSGQDMMTDVMLHHRVVEGLLHDFSYIFG
ncbi:uncharacterized protein LOC143022420 isoform X4 [Oratosquilla oratoria]|uniref:uncharacterized protein LOC143022420 isoform X4 n=1 Tax=Oratosquilla oratoria TaxID=337810 RepID=UPI003F77042A